MNFLCVSSAFLLFQLNIRWTSNYIIKAIGCFMFAAGIKELSDLCRFEMKSYEENSKYLESVFHKGLLSGALCGLSALCIWLLRFLDLKDIAFNMVAVILGIAVACISFELFRTVFMFIKKNDACEDASKRLINNSANLNRMGSAFFKAAICTGVNLFADAVNRFFDIKSVSTAAGLVVTISKIFMYIFLIMIVFQFNKIRTDCNDKFENKE